MIVINFFAGPGSGKSTSAAGLFSKLKLSYYNAELVTEVAKDFVWSKRYSCLENQILVTTLQYERLRILSNQVDFAVTDSPILLGSIYNKEKFPSYNPLIFELFNSFQNINIIVKRVKPYVKTGRLQTLDEAKDIDIKIKNMLISNAYDYLEFDGDENIVDNVFNYIKEKYA